MSYERERIMEYLEKTRFIVLGTVWQGKPELRTIASFGMEGFCPVFSTHKATSKARQMRVNPHVSLLFEHENQKLRTFVNITISGIARRVDDSSDQKRIIEIIGARSPGFLDRAARGDLVEQVFFRVEPVELKILDFSISPSPEGVRRIRFEEWKDVMASVA